MSIDWFTFIAQVINFAVLVAFLNRFLYGPILDAIDSRSTNIGEQLDAARQLKQQANEEKLKYENLNTESENARQSKLARINQESESLRQRLLQEARHEVKVRRDGWQASLKRDQEYLVKQLVQKSSGQAIAISTKVLQVLAGQVLEEQVVQHFLNHLANLPSLELERLQVEAKNKPDCRVETAFPVSPDCLQQIRRTINQELGVQDLQLLVTPEIVLGITLRIGSLKTGWNVREYLESLEEEIRREID